MQAAAFQLNSKEIAVSLRLAFANLIVGVIQSEQHAEVQLFIRPSIFSRTLLTKAINQRQQDPIVFMQRLLDTAWGQVQFGQPPATVFHQFEEFENGLSASLRRLKNSG